MVAMHQRVALALRDQPAIDRKGRKSGHEQGQDQTSPEQPIKQKESLHLSCYLN